ncbi:TPR Domain containing protein [Trichomonas vaginalis G3]|uniref:TPR Domain containing protein n=1 Tax=Trichomonas vaginalis (strain ATCC PRA-98 / G3) TaxID=412133 RepID=A2F129_TRIV3|nr:intraflagellar transport protein 88-like protein family [Trichomonas vaginalis G3]EAY01380.1 TPR Domain containing protein [Trichomonas vaginalis G3]KAI5497470.1 intraflagellar transport protein 88-like protein family [Trichomonas vaginalis G3]|eukprot:XP_001330228.1 TPR Domain containing protein [Trichomonas vaginalis G3]
MSSRKGAGYNSDSLGTSGGKKVISPLDHVRDSFAQFIKDTSDSPENKLKKFKKDIMDAIVASSQALAADPPDPQLALTKAKEAETQMKALQDFITSKNVEELEFKTYKYTVLMQLADAYKANTNYDEAIHRYERLLKDHEYPNQFMAYLEIGNINMALGKYEDAVKNYNMGINYLKPEHNRFKARFNHACGVAQICLGQYHLALSSFETAMRVDPSIKTGFNLVLCHAILSSTEDMREAYKGLLGVKPVTTISDLQESDVLGNQLHVERREQVRLVMLTSRLVASKSDKDWQEAYDFVLQRLKQSKFPEATGEFEIAYSLAHLNHRNADKAIEILRQIRKKDPALMALAATNLSFLYYLEQDYENANKYAQMALDHDKYNAQALVNKGNCLMQSNHEDEARDQYLEAIGVEADCVEALYNLGVVSKMMGQYEEALQVFEKLNRIIPKAPEVAFEISDCYEKAGFNTNAIEWLHRLINIQPKDPAIWRRLGAIWDRDQNEAQAFQCYTESYKYCPSDIDVIQWLGSYFRKKQSYDQALKFFERASELAPKQPRYLMMVASCHRNMDQKQEALTTYEKVMQLDPNNKQCLEHLIKLTTEMGLSAKADYYQRLYKDLMERIAIMQQEEMEAQQQQGQDDTPMGFQPQQFGNDDFRRPQDNVMNFGNQRENVVAPDLNVDANANGMVQNARAGEGDGNMWDDVDIDLPD